jgi:hypothetical protein
VLRVPNAALRFRPSAEMVAEVRAERAAAGDTSGTGPRADSSARAAGQARAAASPQGAAGMRPASGGPDTGSAGSQGRPANVATLWYVDANGRLQVARAHTGLTDGQQTEVSGPALREGMRIIAGVTTGSSAAAETSTVNPFQGQQQQGRRGPGGF